MRRQFQSRVTCLVWALFILLDRDTLVVIVEVVIMVVIVIVVVMVAVFQPSLFPIF